MNAYLQKLLDEQKMPVIFDYDGVLFEARWYEHRINMPNETEERLYEAMKRGENLHTKPIPFMSTVVKNIQTDMFVLSHIHNEIEYHTKCDQVEKYYPSIPRRNVLWAKSPEDKINFMEDIRRTYGPFICIDDTHPNLIMYENHFDESCKFFHVSSLYV